jgi:hypothetical protein
MYSKIAILTGIGMTELRFLRLIPTGKILLLIVIQTQYQLISGFFQLIEIRGFDPLPDKVINSFAPLFGIPLCN